jgi:hypothetical protein
VRFIKKEWMLELWKFGDEKVLSSIIDLAFSAMNRNGSGFVGF